MPDYLHAPTKRLYRSVAPANLEVPVEECIESPDLSQVDGWPTYYWVVTLSPPSVTLADQATRDAIDAQLESDQRDRIADQIDRQQSILRAFAEVVLDEINLLRDEHPGFQPRTLSQLKTAIRNKLNG